MRQMGLFPDIFTNNIIINGYCKQGRMKSAIDTFMDMHNFGLVPDVVTYNTLISGYCKGFDMVNADNLVYEMYNSGWDPDVTTYNIRIHGFSGSRRMNRAVLVFNELLSSGIVPNTTTYNTMLNAICYDILDRAMILTARLLKLAFVPNTVTTNLLLSHLRRQGLPERALMWGQHLRQISHEFDEITYKILERADRDIKEDAVYLRGTSGKSLFLDFLMFLTYDYLYRNKLYSETDTSTIRMINNSSSRSLEATTRIHQQPMLEANK
ncbi:tetratricopeptide-like helical domain-containing protein [Artemisia annua]|uniref:Tetratricopeptide-like helical domain-containing protein n=1 Tax=Artemisia annua TaxID=35608 RepID=A0A2U1KAY4_ARTAN|nr:tetratricopeptide-like helical domain-containing protein [Artemisia annua]